MSSLRRPSVSKIVELPSRKAAVVAKTDVLIIGGGPAGLGAAFGASKSGVEAVVVDRYGFFGGNATAALVMPWASHYAAYPKKDRDQRLSLFPQDQTAGQKIIGGAADAFLNQLVEAGGAIAPSEQTGWFVPFDPEIFKITCFDFLDNQNVRYLTHAFASSVLQDDRGPTAVVFETKSGPIVIEATVIIDCTGDGDIAAYSGAEFDLGRDEDGLVQPATLMFRIADFDKSVFKEYVKQHPNEWRGVHGLWDLVKKATEAGDLTLPREDILMFGGYRENEVVANCTRIIKVKGTNVFDLSYAERESRRQLKNLITFLKRYVPGFENAYVSQSGTQVGIRETRRIRGRYRLTADDVTAGRKFDDAIAQSSYPMDIHNPMGRGTVLNRVPEGDFYQIPLRCLVPEGLNRLLIAGRCISGSHEAHSSYRVMPVSMSTGHAAGVCAALAVRQSRSPAGVRAQDVQVELEKQNAVLSVPKTRLRV